MELLGKKAFFATALAVSIPLHAKTFDQELRVLLEADPLELHHVIVTFQGHGPLANDQLSALSALGIEKGVYLKNLPIAGVLATKGQVEALYQRDDVISVWNNDRLVLENYESTQITGVQKLRADQALRSGGIPYSGKGIGVVVNDSGIDGLHSDLAFPEHVVQNVLAQTNLNSLSTLLPITYQEDVPNTDIAGGHGSHVAGTVGGNGAMSSGIQAGVAPGADIIGYGSGAGLFILDTLGGFDYALTHQFDYNIRVISNSFGNTGDVGTPFNPDDPTNVATKALADRGIITVFSAGNSGPGESTITGNFKKAPWVVTVAAGDKEGNLAEFSSRGVKDKGGEVVVDGEVYHWEDRPTVTAPGVDVISVRASTSSLGGLSAQDDMAMIPADQLPFYTVSSGTSMAAPHVSGIVALMLEADPNLDWRGVKGILQATATPMTGRESWETGAGYVNAYAAVNASVNGEQVYGDTTKLQREFNASANISEGDSFTLTTTYLPVGESPTETFVVGDDVSMVLASASIETATAFVLEDPAGNQYGSGIGLPLLGSAVGTAAPGMPGTWKLYSRGIGSVSGVSLDPLGLTNGIGVPSTTEVNIRTLKTAGYANIDDSQTHPARHYIEYVVGKHLMDGLSGGFRPDELLNKLMLADTMTLASSVRQPLVGNTPVFRDVDMFDGAVNAVASQGGILADREMNSAPVVQSVTDSYFGADEVIDRTAFAYSLVQSLNLQAAAESFDPQDKLVAIVFGEAVEVADTADIAADMRGYVQQALTLGLIKIEVALEQGAFDLEPKITAYFRPHDAVSRADAAFSLTLKDQLVGQ